MLQSIHDQAQSWIAWVIVGLLIIPFALWGINSYFDGGASAVVAEVNGTEIDLRDYQRSLQQQRQKMRSLLGKNYRPEMMESPQMRRAVLDAMIENDLLSQTVESDGFRISDGLLFSQIQQIEAFQHDGKFSPTLYEQILSAQGMDKSFFEGGLRSDLMQSQLLTGFRHSSFVTGRELREAVRLQQQKRSLRILTIPATLERLESQQVGDEEIAAQYELNAAAYEIPEQVGLEYIELSVAEIANEIEVDEAELKMLYAERKDGMIADEERDANHILIELAEDADDKATNAAEARMSEVIQKLSAGEVSFEVLAVQYSDDPGSANTGGDLGFFPRGIMDPEFDEVAFSMGVGEVSEPVRTPFGLHLIRLNEIQAEEIRPYEEVRGELSAELKRRAAEDLFFEYAETIANIAYEKPDSLDGAAREAGLAVKQSGLFSRQGATSGVATTPEVVKAAFSGMVLTEGKNSDPIELAEDHMVVVRVRAHLPATRKPLDEVRQQVVAAILEQRARVTAKSSGVELLEKVQGGELSAEAAAERLELQWGEIEKIGRSSHTVAPEVVARAFRINHQADGSVPGQTRYTGTELRGGDYVLIELSAVDDGDLSSMDEREQESLRRELTNQNVKRHYQSYIASLRDQAEVVVFEDQLN